MMIGFTPLLAASVAPVARRPCGMMIGLPSSSTNREGIAPRSAATWSAATIRNILKNPAHAGERYSKKRAHRAIISRQLWNRVQMAS